MLLSLPCPPPPPCHAESGGSITLLQALLGAGYHVTLLPTAAEGQAPQHAAALRHAGVGVVPPLPPAQWLLSHAGRCLFDVVWVASSSAYEAVRQQLELHCPGIALARGTDGAAGLEAEEGGAGRNGSSGGSSEAKAQALPSTPQQALLQVRHTHTALVGGFVPMCFHGKQLNWGGNPHCCPGMPLL